VADLFLRNQKGSILAFLTISMTVIVSFAAGVMDIGLMYENRRQLQNGVDGAALAGAMELALGNGQAKAVNTALDYAQRNGITVSNIDAGYPEVANEGPYTDNAVVVAATRHLSLLVAGIFNNGAGDVRAQATAVIAPLLPTEGVWPWGVPQSDIVPGQLIPLKVGAPPPVAGNFRPLDLPPLGGGSNAYQDGIEYGYGHGLDDYISATLPWDVYTETGNKVGATKEGVDYLVGLAASSGQDDPSSSWNEPDDVCTWPGAPKNPSDPDVPPPASWVGNASVCYRVGIIPILQSYDVHGMSMVTVVGWGAFYLIGYSPGPGGLTYVWGYFNDMAIISGGRTNWGAPLSGLIGVRLWR